MNGTLHLQPIALNKFLVSLLIGHMTQSAIQLELLKISCATVRRSKHASPLRGLCAVCTDGIRESPVLLFQCGGIISAFESHYLVTGMVSYSVLKATIVN